MKKAPPPHLSLELSDFDLQDRADVWRDVNAGLYTVKPNSQNIQDLSVSARAHRIGHTVLGEYKISGNTVKRGLQGFHTDDVELLVLRMHRKGSTYGVLNDVDFKMQSTHLTMFDLNQSLNATTKNVDYVSFVLPYSAIGYDPSKHKQIFQAPLASHIGRVIRGNLEALVDLVPNASVQDRVALSEGFCGMLRALVLKDSKDVVAQTSLAFSREVAARRYIDERIKDTTLSVASICQAVGITPKDLSAFFKSEGGVRRAILSKRMEGALDELSQTEPHYGAISRVARSWCFKDAAQFSRQFREFFGFRPTDVLGTELNAEHSRKRQATCAHTNPRPKVRQLISLYKDTLRG